MSRYVGREPERRWRWKWAIVALVWVPVSLLAHTDSLTIAAGCALIPLMAEWERQRRGGAREEDE